MSTELAQNNKYTLEQLIGSEKFGRELEKIVHTPENVKRFVQIGLHVLKRQPALAQCTQVTVFDALYRLAQVGLEPDGYHAHLVPFNNKIKWKEGDQWKERWEKQCQLIIDYKGMINVIRRNPKVSVLKGGVIYKMDQFTFEEGSNRVFAHRRVYPEPGTELKSNPIVLVYAFIRWTNNDWDVDIMTVDEIERVRDRSRAKDSGPWVSDWAEMAMKTAIRHLCKRLELTYEQRQVVTADDDQFGFQNPFEAGGQPQQLTYTRPEFNDGSKVPPDDQQDAGSAVADKSTELRADTNAKGSRKRGDQRGKAESKEGAQQTNRADSTTQPAQDDSGTRDGGSNVGSTPRAGTEGVQEETKVVEHQFGPSADLHQEPKQETNTGVSEQSTGANTEQTNGTGVEEAAQNQEANKNLAKLVKLIQNDKIAEEAVISVLMKHDRDVGFAADSGKVSDLPDEAIKLCVRNWASVVFNAKKAAAEKEG